jgi:hypothetical protein
MRKTIAILAMFFGMSANAQNPFQPKQATIDALKNISFLVGNWKGKGWMQMGPEKHTFTQTEYITPKANGTVIQIEGLGKDEKNTDVIIHQAFAVISYDIQNNKYLFKAYKGDGGQIDADVKLLDDHTFQWGFSSPMTGQIKYTISVVNNKWTEIGEMSRDGGKTWMKYFEMILDRQ